MVRPHEGRVRLDLVLVAMEFVLYLVSCARLNSLILSSTRESLSSGILVESLSSVSPCIC
jgi:hypothetical protein